MNSIYHNMIHSNCVSAYGTALVPETTEALKVCAHDPVRLFKQEMTILPVLMLLKTAILLPLSEEPVEPLYGTIWCLEKHLILSLAQSGLNVSLRMVRYSDSTNSVPLFMRILGK